MKRPNFPYFRAFYYSSFSGKFPEIALIMGTPFVETLLVLPEETPKSHFLDS